MPIKKGERITQAKLNAQRRQAERLSPTLANQHITKFESWIANVMQAQDAVCEKFDINVDQLRLLAWLYQFEFFEKQYAKQFYKYTVHRELYLAERHAIVMWNQLERAGYLEPYKTREGHYSIIEQRDGYKERTEVEVKNTFRISDKAHKVLKEYFYQITSLRPLRWGTRHKVLIWDSQDKEDLNDYQEY